MNFKKEAFFDGDSEWEDLGQGVSRQFVGYNSQIMMVIVKFEKDAVGVLHQHFHSQITYVASGTFEVTVDGVTKILKEGDGFFAQPNIFHGVKCLEEGKLIDAFAPFREDFLK
ncbi:cupin domain-containing protein [Chryseobacterium shandongense]|jgi:quercetin dioxygenase-like cupin family protein|uniref:Cupin domain-containing protein n=1 Tax=Chryseobacterium shandongense TaxID=1493872 RepID=A0AAD0YKU4_9FLAO|nr:cupin domain-containing protein [Chryseobacterium shandongense]AZA89026.1 cupin domain-containing protein [Chryseobacterium shandongense]AZA97969.1 cupin domain-containing protein [Chryseobacterium shandongense]